MYEAKFVHGLDGQCDLRHVEPCDILTEDLVLDQHGHEITTGQELHQHVEECRVLERRMQLDEPGAIGVG